MQDDLADNEAIVAVVTSEDIDSIAIHLFSISFYWARKENGKFKNKVYVLLQKQKPELYNITGIIELLEERFGLESACNISIILCLGGNDFLPKYQGISHEKWISTVIDTPGTLTNLIKFTKESWKPISVNLNEEIYLNIYICQCYYRDDSFVVLKVILHGRQPINLGHFCFTLPLLYFL
jgi:hypothetical protein